MLNIRIDLRELDLNLLYTFRIFAEAGSVSETAKHLGRSQPAISARLHQIQDDLGAPLFVRHGRGLELTPLGRAVSERLESTFGDVRSLLDLVRQAATQPTGILRVGCLPTVGVYLVAPVVAHLQGRHEGVEFDLAYGLDRDSLDRLRHGHLDAVVGIGDRPAHGFDIVTLGRVDAALISRKDDRLFRRRTLSPHALQEQRWVGTGRVGDAFLDGVWDFLERNDLAGSVRIRVPHIQSVKELIREGAGISILPAYTARETEFDQRRIEGLDVGLQMWLAMRHGMAQVPLADRFEKQLRKQAKRCLG